MAATATRAHALAERAREAAQVRAYETDPDVVALKVEKVRTTVNRLIWSAIGLGLAFTAANVQAFAADGADAWTVKWSVAWLLDPMVSLVVVAILLAEGVTSRWQVHTGEWVRAAKWFALGSTYVMNTWQAWAEVFGSAARQGWDHVVQHSVPVLLVLVAAEAGPILREKLTEAVFVAARHAADRAAAERTAAHDTAHPVTPVSVTPLTTEATAAAVSAPVTAERTATVSTQPEPVAVTAPVPLTDLAPLTAPAPLAASASVDVDQAAGDDPQHDLADVVDVDQVPVEPSRWALHLVTPPTPHTRLTTHTEVPSQQAPGDETAGETADETADPEARMRAYWDREVAAGRVPTGADLARSAGGAVSPATGRRRRATWESELPEPMRGGAVHASA